MPTIGDAYVAEGVAKGLAQGQALGLELGRELGQALGLELGRELGQALGLEQGRVQAKAETLMRMLRRRFGEGPEAIERKVSAAAVSEIDNWIDALVDGKPLDAVFEDPTH